MKADRPADAGVLSRWTGRADLATASIPPPPTGGSGTSRLSRAPQAAMQPRASATKGPRNFMTGRPLDSPTAAPPAETGRPLDPHRREAPAHAPSPPPARG